jgi:hypothetical protein
MNSTRLYVPSYIPIRACSNNELQTVFVGQSSSSKTLAVVLVNIRRSVINVVLLLYGMLQIYRC